MGNIEKDIADVVRSHRVKRDWTQADLAKFSGIPLRTIQGLESGKSDPRFETIRAIASAMALSASDLWESPSPKPSPSSVTGTLTADDGALILARLASATPAQRALALTILFEEPEFLKDFELPKELVPSILGSVKVK